MRSGAFESWVSSKSIAWPAVPLARAASEAGARVSGGPKMVASACPPCAPIWSCTMREQESVDPARITPVPSSTQRRPSPQQPLREVSDVRFEDEVDDRARRAHSCSFACRFPETRRFLIAGAAKLTTASASSTRPIGLSRKIVCEPEDSVRARR